MESVLVEVGKVLGLALLGTMFLTVVASEGLVRPWFTMRRATADVVNALAISGIVPLFAAVFLAAPHGWQAQDWRNSSEFRWIMAVITIVVEILVVARTVRVIRAWRAGGLARDND